MNAYAVTVFLSLTVMACAMLAVFAAKRLKRAKTQRSQKEFAEMLSRTLDAYRRQRP